VLPAWVARTTHVPGLSSLMAAPCVPPAVQTVGVVVVKVTGKPEDVVALTGRTGRSLAAVVTVREPRWTDTGRCGAARLLG
jgi:hypothetical protein